uniref:Polyprenal reductase n=1 Tax=Nothoprocta perdicaria TaxID=30464 RepID=A0A8C7EBD7_NOTPE
MAAALWALLAASFLAALLLQRARARRPGGGGDSGFFQELIRYGKTKSGGERRPASLRLLHVPKRWFIHFYAVSVLWNGFLLIWLLQAQSLPGSLSSWLQHLHHALGRASQNEDMGSEHFSALLVLLLLWLHSFRRLAECLWTSVFSDGVIHTVQYCFGLGYYVALGLTVLCQVPANFRNGKVINLSHSVPYGDWFERVSCPHYFAEVLIYVSMAITLGLHNVTWWFVVLYVLSNQALAAVLCHEFYQNKFSSYPKHRKAFIPFVY